MAQFPMGGGTRGVGRPIDVEPTHTSKIGADVMRNIAAVFGPTVYDLPLTTGDATNDMPMLFESFDRRHIPQLSFVIQRKISDAEQYAITEVCVLVKTDHIGANVFVLKFNDESLEIRADGAPSNLVSFSKSGSTFTMEQKGLALTLDSNFAKTKAGMSTLAHQIKQISNATVISMCRSVLYTIFNTASNPARDNLADEEDIIRSLREEMSHVGAMHLPGHLQSAVAFARTTIFNQTGQEANMVIVPFGTGHIVNRSKAEFNGSLGNVGSNVRIRESFPMINNTDNGASDPFVSYRQFGAYTIIPFDPHVPSDRMQIKVWSEHQDSFVPLSAVDVIPKLGLYRSAVAGLTAYGNEFFGAAATWRQFVGDANYQKWLNAIEDDDPSFNITVRGAGFVGRHLAQRPVEFINSLVRAGTDVNLVEDWIKTLAVVDAISTVRFGKILDDYDADVYSYAALMQFNNYSVQQALARSTAEEFGVFDANVPVANGIVLADDNTRTQLAAVYGMIGGRNRLIAELEAGVAGERKGDYEREYKIAEEDVPINVNLLGACVKESWPLPVNIVLLTPHITFLVGHMMVMAAPVGQLRYMTPDFIGGKNSATKMFHAHYTINYGVLVEPEGEKKMVLIRDVLFKGYLGGFETHYIHDMSADQMAYRSGTSRMCTFAIITRPDVVPSGPLDISGRRLPYDTRESFNSPPGSFPGLAAAAMHMGWNQIMPGPQHVDMQGNSTMSANTICFRASQYTVESLGNGNYKFTDCRKGMFPMPLYEGSAAVRSGVGIMYSGTNSPMNVLPDFVYNGKIH